MSFIEPGLFDMIMRLRGRGISDSNVLRAMELVKRSGFVPDEFVPQSYDERPIPIPCGQTMLAPLDVAIMCQSLDVHPEHKVLHVGVGSGYTTAVLGKMCTRVYGIDRYRTLVELSELNISKYAHNTVLRYSDGRLGWKGQAPFDRILVSASVRVIPIALQEQLAKRGRIICGVDGQLVKAEFVGKALVETPIFPLELPALEAGKSKSL